MIVTHAKSKADYIYIEQDNFISSISMKQSWETSILFSQFKRKKLVEEDSEVNIMKMAGNRELLRELLS